MHINFVLQTCNKIIENDNTNNNKNKIKNKKKFKRRTTEKPTNKAPKVHSSILYVILELKHMLKAGFIV